MHCSLLHKMFILSECYQSNQSTASSQETVMRDRRTSNESKTRRMETEWDLRSFLSYFYDNSPSAHIQHILCSDQDIRSYLGGILTAKCCWKRRVFLTLLPWHQTAAFSVCGCLLCESFQEQKNPWTRSWRLCTNTGFYFIFTSFHLCTQSCNV